MSDFIFKSSSIISSHTRQTSEVFRRRQLGWGAVEGGDTQQERRRRCINIRSNTGNITPKLISARRGISACFLYLRVCGPGRVFVLVNVKDCLYNVAQEEKWGEFFLFTGPLPSRRKAVKRWQQTVAMVSSSQVLGLFGFFLQERHPCMQTVSKWVKTKHRLDKCDMMPAHILHGESFFFFKWSSHDAFFSCSLSSFPVQIALYQIKTRVDAAFKSTRKQMVNETSVDLSSALVTSCTMKPDLTPPNSSVRSF